MIFDFPLLKYACNIESLSSGIQIGYRLQKYNIVTSDIPSATKAIRLMNGRNSVKEIAANTNSDTSLVEELVEQLSAVPIVLDGKAVLRLDGLLSGAELFWRLEALLFRWRYGGPRSNAGPILEEEIASGRAPEEVVKGYCIEICHQVRNAPTEIAYAIASSPASSVRALFMEFYEEEKDHGQMLLDELDLWLHAREKIVHATPLPTTTGLIHSYNCWAQKDVLMYATALMRDEKSSLDPPPPPELDIYAGMREHYSIPPRVVDFFTWHESFDQESGHGFFPEKVFAQFPVIDSQRAATIVRSLRTIIDMYDALMLGIHNYYGRYQVETRWSVDDQLYGLDA